MSADLGVQYEWAGSEMALIRVVELCLPCGGGIISRRIPARLEGTHKN